MRLGRLILVVLLLLGVSLGAQRARLGKALPSADRPIVPPTPPPPSGSTITLADITLKGIFGLPNTMEFVSCLTGRYVSGTLYLYTIYNQTGDLYEFAPIADGSLVTGGSGYVNASIHTNFGDIYQNEIYRSVDAGYGGGIPTPYTGLPYAGIPQGCFWDEPSSRFYWSKVQEYNNTFNVADPNIGYSTLAATTGTGIGNWSLWKPNGNGAGQDPSQYNNRWGYWILKIPTAFATTYLGGRTIGIGGGGSLSIASNTQSWGPTLFSVDPANFTAGTDKTYAAGSILPILFYPNTGPHEMPRLATTPMNKDVGDAGDPQAATTWSWGGSPKGWSCGVWINGTNKQGFIQFTTQGTGSINSAIQASPAPTHNTFTVANAGNTAIGSYIRWPTDTTVGDGSRAFNQGIVSGVSGNAITLDAASIVKGIGGADPTSLPIVGGSAFGGIWYSASGTDLTGSYHEATVFSLTSMATLASGTSWWTGTPSEDARFNFANLTYPQAGVDPAHFPYLPGAIRGCWLNETTTPHRIYFLIAYPTGPTMGSSLHLIYEYEVAD